MSLPEADRSQGATQRLQKIIAAAGLASRRKAETLISRPTMIDAVTAMTMPGQPPRCDSTSRKSVTATISLSATGSRNAPKAEVWFMRRAR